jgi:hypothetical protein
MHRLGLTVALLASSTAGAADIQQFPATLAGHAALPALTLIQPPANAPELFKISGRFAAQGRRRVEELGAIPTVAFTADKAAPRSSGVGLPLAGQPAQGMSGIVASGTGSFLLLTDNGYGSRISSPDTLLMVHKATADWATGGIRLDKTVFLYDPDKKIPFAIRNEATVERYLTGADLDPESLAVVGERWFMGDEFGPYIIEADPNGRVVAIHETRVDGKTVRSPDHYRLSQLPNTPTSDPGFQVRRSRGFEPMSATPDGQRLIAMFEGPLFDDQGEPEPHLRLLEFDVATGAWTGKQWRYRPEDPAHVIGDLAMIDGETALVIERDDGTEGSPRLACQAEPKPDCFNVPAKFKRVFKIDLAQTADGFVRKVGYIDLLDIADPEGRSHAAREPDGKFIFPFQGPEGVAIVDAQTIAVINDNNLPYNASRTLGKPDDREIALLRAPELMAAR